MQQLSTLMPHSGASSELLEVTCSQGTSLYLVYPIRPAAIIDELKASVWVRCAAAGLRIGFRAVFPNTAHPLTGNQLAIYLEGEMVSRGGQWSPLEIQSPLRMFQQRVAMLRHEYGPDIDLRGAYIDAVVINPYTGPGLIRLQIDDLAVDGNVELQDAVDPSAGESRTNLSVSMAERINDLHQGVPRWLQYRGESLTWLKTLGVTGVVLDAPKDARWLREAQVAGLKVLSPPPGATPPEQEWSSYDAVQGWVIGSALDASHVEPSRQLRAKLSQYPVALRRPTLAESMEQHWIYSRVADALAVPAPLPSTVRDGHEMVQLLRASYEQARGRTMPLTSLTLQPTPEYEEQTRELMKYLGRQPSGPSIDVLQARMRLYRCIAAGARGWYLRSQAALDSGDESDLLHGVVIRALNAEVDWLSPWIQASNAPLDMDPASTPGYRGTILPMNNSQLILLLAQGENDSILAPTPSNSPLEFPVPNFQTTSQVVRITHGRLEPILQQVSPKEAKVRIEQPGMIELVVITTDPRVTTYLQQRSPQAVRALLDVHAENANQLRRLAQTTLVAENQSNAAPNWRTVRDADALTRQMDYLMGRDLPAAMNAAEQACHLYQSVIRDSWKRALGSFSNPQSSPWLENVAGLPIHWELQSVVANRTWMPAEIPGMQWGDWEAMQRLGWNIDRRIEEQVDSRFELASSQGVDGSMALRLQARSTRGEAIQGGFAGSSLRMYSPPIDIPRHALVRIDGLVQVRRSSPVAQSGLLFYDDIAGPASGCLIQATPGVSGNWIPVTLFRYLSREGGVRIMMETRGEGEFLVSNFRVTYLIPAATSSFPLTQASNP
ncbi:MAG: hypothetical protein U0905_17720 [Pirellulales bacterium]